MGDTEYCTQGADAQAGLSSAIGGCGTRQIDHVNAFASLARMGTYKPTSTVLEVKNSQGEVIKQYKDESKQVLDPQIAYIISDILTDDNARAPTFGRAAKGFVIPGVKTATKTGTSDKDGKAKDIWTMSYSPALTMGVWLGNPDTSILKTANSTIPARTLVAPVMEFAHKEVYAKDGTWNPANGGEWFARPAGIQVISNELFPSWYKKDQGKTNSKLTFDKLSKKKATACTPQAAKIEVDVQKFADPITKKDVFIAPDGYDATADDDLHKCDDAKPTVGTISMSKLQGKTYRISTSVVAGTHQLKEVAIKVGETIVATLPASASGPYAAEYTFTSNASQAITVTVTDVADYQTAATQQFAPTGSD